MADMILKNMHYLSQIHKFILEYNTTTVELQILHKLGNLRNKMSVETNLDYLGMMLLLKCKANVWKT